MAADIKNLPENIDELKSIIISQHGELTAKHEFITQLQEQNTLLRKELFGRKSEKLNPEEIRQGLLFNEIETYAGGENEGQGKPQKVKSHKRKKKRGRKALPESLPRVEIKHDLPENERGQRRYIGSDSSEFLVIIPEKIYIERHLYLKYALPEGVEIEGEPAVKAAPVIPRLIPRSIASGGLLAYVLTAKFCDHLPFFRLEKIFSRWGVELKRATMCNWAISVAKRCEKMTEMMWEQVRAEKLALIDETTLQVLNETGRKNTSKSYMYLIRGGPPKRPVVLFNYRETRHAGFLNELLAEFKGAILTDGFAGYNRIAVNMGLIHAGCWDHARRKFVDVQNASGESPAADAVLRLIGKLYAVESEAKGNGLSPAERLELRRKKSSKRIQWFRRWLEKRYAVTLPKTLMGKAVRYNLKQWPKLIQFLENGEIPLSNILAENAIRPFVVGRKGWMFSGSPRGAKASATLYSLIETAKANGLEPYWYLRYLFEKLPLVQDDDDLRQLLPNTVTQDQIRAFFPDSPLLGSPGLK